MKRILAILVIVGFILSVTAVAVSAGSDSKKTGERDEKKDTRGKKNNEREERKNTHGKKNNEREERKDTHGKKNNEREESRRA